MTDPRREDVERLPIAECDLVMKGGVTSGIVYPAAIARIAQQYRLRSIGGTSAGAIGAAAAAAMEYGRTSGLRPDAVARLAEVTRQLGRPAGPNGESFLFSLFAPDPETAPLFRTLLDMRRRGPTAALRGHALRLLRPSIVAGGVSALLLTAALAWLQWPPRGLDLVELGLLLVTSAVTIAGLAAWRRRPFHAAATSLEAELGRIADNGFGLCSGMARAPVGDGGASAPVPALTEWLHATIQDLAGLREERPLTFGDLWTAGQPASSEDEDGASTGAKDAAGDPPRRIDVRLVTSDVSRALSATLPFLRDGRLYARRSDLQALFPASVVAAMAAGNEPDPADLERVDLGGVDAAELLRMPAPQDLPLIVAVRMSMSFPILFRAVRLYAIRRRPAWRGGGDELAELWFADGGLTSNFPIHLFDAPIPLRPTFLLNLIDHDEELEPDSLRRAPRRCGGGMGHGEDGSGEDGGEDEQAGAAEPAAAAREAPEDMGIAAAPGEDRRSEDDLVYMPRSNYGRIVAYAALGAGNDASGPDGTWGAERTGGTEGWRRLAHFGARLFKTARVWGDHQLMDVPGYRDRIVHIGLRKGEGGLNLAMDEARIEALARRGARAGEAIAARFLPGQTQDPLRPGETLLLGWSNHRMVRLRAFLAATETMVRRFSQAWREDWERGELPAADPHAVHPSLEVLVEVLGTSAEERLPQGSGYPFRNAEQRDLALDTVAALRELAALVGRNPEVGLDLVRGRPTSPRPKPLLRMRPAEGGE